MGNEIKGNNPAQQRLLNRRAAIVDAQRNQLPPNIKAEGDKVTAKASGVVGGLHNPPVKPAEQQPETQAQIGNQPKDSKTISDSAPKIDPAGAFRAKTGNLADSILGATINKPFEEGIISQNTRDNLLKMVDEGTLSREAATYLANNVDALGGDVMVNIALDLCKQDPAKFAEDFQAGNLYNKMATEHHDRYYPKPE